MFAQPPGIRLYLATVAVNVLFVSTGSVQVWSSPMVPRLINLGVITPTEGAWVSSVYSIGAIFGPMLISAVSSPFGRRPALLVNAALFLVSWLLLLLPPTFVLLIIARVIGGVAVGASFISVSAYVTEIADEKKRQAVGSVNEVAIGLGYLLEYGVGELGWCWGATLIAAAPSLLFLPLLLFLPESPYHLVAKGDIDGATRELSKLYNTQEVQKQLTDIQTYVGEEKKGSILDLFRKKGPLKALLICFYVITASALTGMAFVQAYTENVFDLAAMEDVPNWVGPVWFGCAAVFASFLAAPIVKKFGAKWVLILSTAFMGLCQIGLGSFMMVLDSGLYNIPFILTLTPIALITIFNAFFCIGVGPLCWVLLAELFPADLKGAATGLIGGSVWMLGFFTIRSFQPILSVIGPSYLFLSFGLATIIILLPGPFIIPNTKGITMAEIQSRLNPP